MKYRLAELLQCIYCQGGLDVKAEEVRNTPGPSRRIFPCRWHCGLDQAPTIPPSGRCDECGCMEIVKGALICRQCGQQFRIVESVPWLFSTPDGKSGDILEKTVEVYSHIWTHLGSPDTGGPAHVEDVEEALGDKVTQGTIGLEAGSGNGADTGVLAKRHPEIEIISLDMSEGVYRTLRRTIGLPNVHVVRASVLALPVKSALCDFGYSFGVLHHTADPQAGLHEIVRVLKPGGRVSLYLYEDHADNPWKAVPLKLVAAIRHVTTKLNAKVLSALCYALSPFIVLVFSVPARVFRCFEATRPLAENMPFNFGTSLFSVHGDLLDRFGAPVEVRYSRESVRAFMEACRLTQLRLTKIRTLAGWVVSGVRNETAGVESGKDGSAFIRSSPGYSPAERDV
nr:class I SAM-dependent methyltransferase [Nitrospirota bacterium]